MTYLVLEQVVLLTDVAFQIRYLLLSLDPSFLLLVGFLWKAKTHTNSVNNKETLARPVMSARTVRGGPRARM